MLVLTYSFISNEAQWKTGPPNSGRSYVMLTCTKTRIWWGKMTIYCLLQLEEWFRTPTIPGTNAAGPKWGFPNLQSSHITKSVTDYRFHSKEPWNHSRTFCDQSSAMKTWSFGLHVRTTGRAAPQMSCGAKPGASMRGSSSRRPAQRSVSLTLHSCVCWHSKFLVLKNHKAKLDFLLNPVEKQKNPNVCRANVTWLCQPEHRLSVLSEVS